MNALHGAKTWIAAALLTVGAGACDTSEPTPHFHGQSGWRSEALTPVQNCDDLEAAIKNALVDRMNLAMDQNLRWALQDVEWAQEYCDCQSSWFGCEENGYAGDRDDSNNTPTPSAEDGASEGSGGGGGAHDYSTTNNQVGGVDEADFIKNDGSFIYLLTGQGFQIFAAWPAPETHLLSTTPIEGAPLRLFVEQGRALVYSDVGEPSCQYDPMFGSFVAGSSIKMTILDIADPSAPRLEREVRLNGSYVAARRIGNQVHTVVSFRDAWSGVSLTTWPDDLQLWGCQDLATAEEVIAAFDALRAANTARIQTLDLGDFLPSVSDTDYLADGSQVERGDLLMGCENFYDPATVESNGFLSVLSVALDNDDSFGAATIIGGSGIVYSSPDNLYVGVTEWLPPEDGSYGGAERTVVHKFSLERNTPAYRASGSVAGRLINQFAMDEFEGRLRLATTVGYAWDPDANSNIFVLEERSPAGPVLLTDSEGRDCCAQADANGEGEGGGEGGCDECPPPPSAPTLVTVGSLSGLAPSEDIRSVRFDETRGFMVTFKKTDPLFTFDLSDPAAPKLLGELEIPGFSTYMHFMDENHLLTIGFDAADQGDFAWFTGIILQIFDVTDMTHPVLTFKEEIGTRGTTSDATNDHLAFNYFKTRDLLALPMGICAGGDEDGGYGSHLTFNGLLVYRVTADEGFTFLGGVDHREASVNDNGYNCYNWWQSPNSQVKRSVFMESFVYSISPGKMKVNDVNALATDLVTLPLVPGEQPPTTYCGYYD